MVLPLIGIQTFHPVASEKWLEGITKELPNGKLRWKIGTSGFDIFVIAKYAKGGKLQHWVPT